MSSSEPTEEKRTISFVLNVEDAVINLEHYQHGLPEGTRIGYIEAINADLELYNNGEIGLDELIEGIAGMTGTPVLKLIGIAHPDGEVETTAIARIVTGEFDGRI